MSKSILLTGAAGFIGSHTAQALLARGDRVVGVDAFDFGYDPAMKVANAALLAVEPSFTMVRGDIRDRPLLESLIRRHEVDTVVHMAARAGVRTSLEDPASYASINVEGTMQVLEALRATGVSRHVFASSSSVYGARTDGPFQETDRVDRPESPYAATKRACELLCGTWHDLYGIQTTCLRFFTVYGPRQRPEMAIRLFAERIASRASITLFGDGSSRRDYTFVADIVRGVLAAVDRPLGFTVVNLGNGAPVTLQELVDTLGDLIGEAPICERLPDQPGDVPLTWAGVDRARTLLGYAPQTSLRDGLSAFLDWLRAEGSLTGG